MARKYDHEYKIRAVKPAKEIGDAKAAKELGISEGTDPYMAESSLDWCTGYWGRLLYSCQRNEPVRRDYHAA